MPSSSVEWHSGGRGNCQFCGNQSPDCAIFTRSDCPGRLLLCGDCAQKVLDNKEGMYERAMRALE